MHNNSHLQNCMQILTRQRETWAKLKIIFSGHRTYKNTKPSICAMFIFITSGKRKTTTEPLSCFIITTFQQRKYGEIWLYTTLQPSLSYFHVDRKVVHTDKQVCGSNKKLLPNKPEGYKKPEHLFYISPASCT